MKGLDIFFPYFKTKWALKTSRSNCMYLCIIKKVMAREDFKVLQNFSFLWPGQHFQQPSIYNKRRNKNILTTLIVQLTIVQQNEFFSN
jgi:c-di-GMP-related signal transduction protein